MPRMSTVWAIVSNGAVEQVERLAVAQVGDPPALVQMIESLRASEQRVVLDRARRPAGDVVGQLFEQRQRAAAAEVAQCSWPRARRGRERPRVAHATAPAPAGERGS